MRTIGLLATRVLGWLQEAVFGAELAGRDQTVTPSAGPTNKCVILVPVAHHIEPACDDALRELERRGYTVWRRYGFSAIDQGRCLLAQQALDAGFDELMWIDADVAFWPGDVDRIRSLNVSMACAAYPVKGWPVMTIEPETRDTIVFGALRSLRAVKYAATGFLYTNARVYRRIRQLQDLSPVLIWGQHRAVPYFYPLLLDGEYLGEDFAFCHRAREAGFTIFLDPTIRLAHIGRYSYSWAFVKNGVMEEPKHLTYTPPEKTRETAGV
jgi:hypothetical protein